MGAFHYQSDQFDDIKPPAFGSYPHLSSTRIKGRERAYKATLEETVENITETANEQAKMEAKIKKRPWWHPQRLRRHKKPEQSVYKRDSETKQFGLSDHVETSESAVCDTALPVPQRFQAQFLHNTRGNNLRVKQSRRGMLVKQSRASMHITASRESKVPLPSLFLQELAHLVSLMSAVAMSTLRNDVENSPSPLMEYLPGKPFPPVDPDALAEEIREEYGDDNYVWRVVYYCLGLSRSERYRTLYNAARPFGVLGGVSDQEILLLQKARGPYAKVSLCSMWLTEFITREYMAGSTGKVGPPIISRLYQFISDGIVGYNQARKVAYIPFPFPHGQITAFFSLTIIILFPMFYYAYVRSLSLACIMNFFTVLCFYGVHEVARELENPFQNVPNDIPLTTFQAQFNEALVTFYSGYHPDAWWELTPEVTVASVDAEAEGKEDDDSQRLLAQALIKEEDDSERSGQVLAE